MGLGFWSWYKRQSESCSFRSPQGWSFDVARIGFPVVLEEPACQSMSCRRHRFHPGWGISPGGGHGNPLQCSFLENPMDRRAWRATVHGVSKSQTRLRWLSPHHRLCDRTPLTLESQCSCSWAPLVWADLREMACSPLQPCHPDPLAGTLVHPSRLTERSPELGYFGPADPRPTNINPALLLSLPQCGCTQPGSVSGTCVLLETAHSKSSFAPKAVGSGGVKSITYCNDLWLQRSQYINKCTVFLWY